MSKNGEKQMNNIDIHDIMFSAYSFWENTFYEKYLGIHCARGWSAIALAFKSIQFRRLEFFSPFFSAQVGYQEMFGEDAFTLN